MEKAPAGGSGAHWEQPDRQIPRIKILHSADRKGLMPIFGTACPLHGLSGKIRELAYSVSESQKVHWLLLLWADRVDGVESALASILRGQAPHPLREMGLASELRPGVFQSRFGENRADVRRQQRELLLILGLGAGTYLARRVIERKAA